MSANVRRNSRDDEDGSEQREVEEIVVNSGSGDVISHGGKIGERGPHCRSWHPHSAQSRKQKLNGPATFALEIFIRTVSACWIAAMVGTVCACSVMLGSVQLQPEEPATVHVGQIATLHVPSERHYTIGSAGRSLMLVRQADQQGTTIYLYRAVQIGNQTLVATPGGIEGRQCISCATQHYFVRVIR